MNHHQYVILGSELGALVVLVALGIWRLAVLKRQGHHNGLTPNYSATGQFDMRRDGQRPDRS
jgi:hypothetical protein